MFRKSLLSVIPLSLAISVAAGAEIPQQRAPLSAAEIVDKNVAVRGGLQAWRAVQTMSLEGKLGAGGNQRQTLAVQGQGRRPSQRIVPARTAEEVQLPFVMELKRPRKMRFELRFNGQTALQVFDGVNGWKFRPFLNRRDVEPYTDEEMQMTSRQADLDGPLIDYVAKGTLVEMQSMEKIEDRDTYKLKLTLKSGAAFNVWIDVQTFLEAKIEGQPRQLDGKEHRSEVYFRDYRAVSGLTIPFVLETKVLSLSPTTPGSKETPIPSEKTMIDKIVVNPTLDDSHFAKPEAGVLALNAK